MSRRRASTQPEPPDDAAQRAAIDAALRAFRAENSAPPWSAWMARRADLRSVAFLFAALGVTALGAAAPRGSVLPHLALVPLSCVLAFLCAVITHNSIHVPVFTRGWLNRGFEALLTLAYGHPVCAFEPGHNLSHHRYAQTPRDVTRTSRVRFRWNLLNQLLFYPAIVRAVGRAEGRYVLWAWRHRRPWVARFAGGMALVLALYAALLSVDVWRFALYGALPHAFAAWGIMGINFPQHDGCDPESPANHSRNFVGGVLNALAFNNGFHGVHHLDPSLHWSLLPAAHAAVLRPHLHPALEQPSLVGWLWSNLVWPGERRTFEGRPYSPPPPVPDEEWLPEGGLEGGAR